MGFWLFKTEPQTFSIDDLAARGANGECWDGVRNYQARNFLRDEVAIGDGVLIYHSSCRHIGIAGAAEVVRAGYPDPSQFDPNSLYYDAAATGSAPRWYAVDVRHRETFDEVVTPAALKAVVELTEMVLLRRGNRLSIMPVTAAQWCAIRALVDADDSVREGG